MLRKNGKINGIPVEDPAQTQATMSELVDSHAPSTAPPVFDENAPLMMRHFHLRSHPFSDNVNPEFFFRTEAHEEAYLAMKQCIDENISLGMTTAVSGTGKTLLTQILMQNLDPRRYRPILILVYPGMTRTALLREVLGELQINEELTRRPTIYTMMNAVQTEIIRLHRKGVKLVIMIDEVHFLRADSLHILRTLSNIEIPERKLVTLLLFGEESLLERMQKPTYRSLLSRIFERATLRPLNLGEVEQYVKFRCLMAGGGPSLFHNDVFERIHEVSGGIPREINRICHTALNRAARKGMIRVEASLFD